MCKKKVSVIVPAYNVEKYIKECLDSILMQVRLDFEIVCINDGSTDNTQQIIEEYCKNNNNIKLVNQKNSGLSATRNVGIENAEGEYIYFLDADDMLSSPTVLCDVYLQCVNKKLDFATFDAKSFFESEEIKSKNEHYISAYQREKEYGFYDEGAKLLADLVNNNKYYQSACLSLYKRSFLNDNNIRFLEGIFFEDNIFSLQCYLAAKKVMHLKKIVMLRRVHGNSIMQSSHTIDKFYSLCLVYFECLNIWQMSDYEEGIDCAIEKIVEERKGQARYYFYNLSESERLKFNTFTRKDKYLIQREVINEEKKFFLNGYIFPYHLFEQGDSVIIYGAGNIGKQFYRIAKHDNLVNLVGIVDKKGSILSEEDIVVLEPKEMFANANFKWLIAIENKEIADSVREYLLENGIKKEKIVWDGINYLRSNKLKNDFVKRRLLGMNSANDNPKMFLFMQPEHGNLGDYAISMGELEFLKRYFPQYNVVKVTTREWIENKNCIKDIVSENDIILINGGGYIGNIWESWKISRDILLSFSSNVKILFPNNFTYSGDGIDIQNAIIDDLSWIKEQEKIYIFFRGKQSFITANKFLKSNVYYAPDMALFLNVKNEKHTISGKALLCFRSDKEKAFRNEDMIVNAIKELGYDYDEKDIHMNKYLPLEEGYIEVSNFIEYLRSFDIVFTDRLHCAILCLISGIPCIAFDNVTHKLTDVSEWIKCKKLTICDSDSFRKDIISEMANCIENNYVKPEESFEKMAEIMAGIINEG